MREIHAVIEHPFRRVRQGVDLAAVISDELCFVTTLARFQPGKAEVGRQAPGLGEGFAEIGAQIALHAG